MRHAPPLFFFTLSLFLLLFFSPSVHAHNITRILGKHPQFSTFNHYLTATHLADEINRRLTITVLALDNSAMSLLLAKQYSIYTLRNILSLHVVADYFGARKLHQLSGGSTLTSTLFQATGSASGTSGYINITDIKGGRVAFGAEDNSGKLDALFVKSLVEMPYNISIIQISQALNSPEAEAPTGGPSDMNATTIMLKQGCKTFANLLIDSGADTSFQESVDGGLTVFCPTDEVLDSFMPRYKNLTGPNKVALLLYHGVPVYQSLQTLRSSNGIINTLATDGASKFDFTVQNDGEDVLLKTKVVSARILGTLKDEEPLIVFKINKVLLPRELFKTAPEEDEAPAPKKAPGKKQKHAAATADGEADTPEADGPVDDSADSTADDTDDNGVGGLGSGRLVMGLVSLCVGVVLMW